MTSENNRGQLFIPMLVLILFFAVFFAIYVRWCRYTYWQMRMDITAEAVALSAARAQAGMLNNLGALQTAGNVFIQKATFFQNNVAHMQVSAIRAFTAYHEGVHYFLKGYLPYTSTVAHAVAKANRADMIPLPWPRPQSRLIPQSVLVIFFAKIYPVGWKTFDNVYYVRSWLGGLHNPQPIHQNAWAVSHKGIVGIASARLWLDVAPEDSVANGGFPRLNGGILENIGIQCFYPHFNARLAPTSRTDRLALTQLAKLASTI